MTRSRLGVPGLVARHLRVGVTASILLALLVALSTLAASLAPRALATLDSAQLRHTVAALPPGAARPLGHRRLRLPDGPGPTAGHGGGDLRCLLQRARQVLGRGVAPALRGARAPAVGGADGRARRRSDRWPGASGAPGDHARRRPRLVVAGSDRRWRHPERPGPVGTPTNSTRPRGRRSTSPCPPTPRPRPTFASGTCSAAIPRRCGSPPCTLRRIPPTRSGRTSPTSPEGNIFQSSGGGFLLYADAFVDPESAVGLRDTLASATFSAWFPIRVDRLRFADAAALSTQARQLSASGSQLTTAQSATFAWGLPAAITAVDRRIALVTSLLALTAIRSHRRRTRGLRARGAIGDRPTARRAEPGAVAGRIGHPGAADRGPRGRAHLGARRRSRPIWSRG